MNEVKVLDKTFEKYISYEELSKAIDVVAEKVNNDYRNSKSVPVFLCVLNGAIMFTAEMMKRLDFEAELISIKITSYTGTESTGTVLIPLGLTGDVKGRDVIIFEDIVDTGNTIVALRDLLLDKGANSVRICTMLMKPEIYKQPVKLDYVGMEVPNKFILGFGLDYNERGRNLKDIYALKDIKKMKYYIIFGPPGAGKGTQSEPMARDYNLCHISTGDLLRAEIAEGTELGLHAKNLIDEGNFVPDEVVEAMIKNKIESTQNVDGFLLDGFPRTLNQAKDLDKMLSSRGETVNGVISLMIPDSTVKERIRHRATVEGRADDMDDKTITNRIRTYHEKTEPIIKYYKSCGKYHEVNGDGGPGKEGIAVVYSRIVELMKNIG